METDDLWRQEVDKKLDHLRAGVEMCMRHLDKLEAELAKLREMIHELGDSDDSL